MAPSKFGVLLLWQFIETRDLNLMQRLNAWHAPRWVRHWMVAATRAGDGWAWYATGLGVLAFGGPDRFSALTATGLAAGASASVFLYLKHATGRKRPCDLAAHAWATLLPPDKFSFPSGHTMTACAVSVPFAGFYPELAAPLSVLTASIAASRIVLGMHFLSDVIAGALFGSALGYAAFTLFT